MTTELAIFLLGALTVVMIVFAVALWAAKRVGYKKGVEDTLEEADKRVNGAYQTGIIDGVKKEKKRAADLRTKRLIVNEKDNRP